MVVKDFGAVKIVTLTKAKVIKEVFSVKIIRAVLLIAVFSFLTSLSHAVREREKDVAEDDRVLKVFTPAEEWFLPTGTQIEVKILNAIFSFNLNTPVVASVETPVTCPKGGAVIFPKYTQLIGSADILKSDNRVNVRFLVAVLPNGREFDLNGIGLSPDGSAGIVASEVKEYKDVKMMSSAVSGALTGVGSALPGAMIGQPIAAGAIGGALQQGSQQASDIGNQKVDVSIFVKPYAKCKVFLTRRLTLDDLLTRDRPSHAPSPDKVEKEMNKKEGGKDAPLKDWRE